MRKGLLACSAANEVLASRRLRACSVIVSVSGLGSLKTMVVLVPTLGS